MITILVIGIVVLIIVLGIFDIVICCMYSGKNMPKCEMCDDHDFPGNDDKCPLCRRPRDW